MSGLTLLLPARNEALALPDVLRRARAALEALRRPFEIVVVDDRSSDATAALATAGGARVVSGPGAGYGAALKCGIRAASYDTLVLCDADGSYPIERLAELVGVRADMVIASRLPSPRADSLLRRTVRRTMVRSAELASGRRLGDVNSGFRVVRRADLLRLEHLLPDRFSFTTTLTLALLAEGRDVRFVPLPYAPRLGRSKWRPVRDTLRFGRALALGVARLHAARAAP